MGYGYLFLEIGDFKMNSTVSEVGHSDLKSQILHNRWRVTLQQAAEGGKLQQAANSPSYSLPGWVAQGLMFNDHFAALCGAVATVYQLLIALPASTL